MGKANLIIFLLTLAINFWYADNPVRCTLHEIVGNWTFVLSSETFEPDLHSKEITCGKGQPGRILKVKPNVKLKFNSYTKMDVSLTYDSKAITKNSIGDYTLLLQEGIIVKTNNLIFNTFWRYNFIGSEKEVIKLKKEQKENIYLNLPKFEDILEEDMSDKSLFESIWYETMVGKSYYLMMLLYFIGWYHTLDNKVWGCFYGYKTKPLRAELDPNTHTILDFESLPFEPGKKKADTASIVERLYNEGKLKFSIYQDFNSHPIERKIFKNSANKIDIFKLVGKNPNSINENELPEYLNWADIEGESYFPEIIKQKWGECYAEAFLHVFESRIRIMTRNRVKPNISREHILGCNFYAEGCDGGLPLNVAKFAHEFFLVEEEWYFNKWTHPKKENITFESNICCDKCDEESTKYGIESYGYVGGYYGAGSESFIMKEIASRGPVSAVINAPDYFDIYTGGILHSISPINEKEVSRISTHNYEYFLSSTLSDISHNTMRDLDFEFEYVNHSIVILGWGYDPEEDLKYWIWANSWGKEWGEEGYFRIVRGINDMAIESAAECYIPKHLRK